MINFVTILAPAQILGQQNTLEEAKKARLVQQGLGTWP